jgi:hypothetical protein
VIKNNDDEGWAVEMIKQGEAEPALVGPWTMGRDKKNPKPLDTNAFNTLVKTAARCCAATSSSCTPRCTRVRRQTAAGRITVTLDIVPDDDDPHACWRRSMPPATELARVRVAPASSSAPGSAAGWVADSPARLTASAVRRLISAAACALRARAPSATAAVSNSSWW